MSIPPNMQGRRGRVFMRRENAFRTDNNEEFRNHGQLPQFLPRRIEHWPSNADQLAQSLNPDYYEDLEDPDDYDTDLAERVSTRYQRLTPPPAFTLRDEGPAVPIVPTQYRGIEWHRHIGHVHNLYYHQLQEGRSIEWAEIRSLLAIISYGMAHSMTWLEEPFAFDSSELVHDPVLDIDTAQGAFAYEQAGGPGGTVPDATILAIQQRIAGRRWIVVPVHSDGNHWNMTIFDRQEGQLYIMDTWGGGRDERITYIVHLWARFWNRMGAPYHFTYFAPPTTQQEQRWECGYLGCLWVMFMLRDQVGDYIRANDKKIPQMDITIGPPDPDYELRDSSLPVREWRHLQCVDSNTSFHIFFNIIEVLLANELGQGQDPALNQMLTVTSSDGSGEQGLSSHGAIGRFTDHLWGTNGWVNRWAYYSSLGGAPLYPVQPTREYFDRFPEQDRMFPIEDREAGPWALDYLPSQLRADDPAVNWINDRRFTVANPPRRPEPDLRGQAAPPPPPPPPNDVHLIVESMRIPLDQGRGPGVNTQGPWEFDVAMTTGRRRLPLAQRPLSLRVHNPRFIPLPPRTQTSGASVGPLAVRFDVTASFPDHPRMIQPVEFTYELPQQYQPTQQGPGGRINSGNDDGSASGTSCQCPTCNNIHPRGGSDGNGGDTTTNLDNDNKNSSDTSTGSEDGTSDNDANEALQQAQGAIQLIRLQAASLQQRLTQREQQVNDLRQQLTQRQQEVNNLRQQLTQNPQPQQTQQTQQLAPPPPPPAATARRGRGGKGRGKTRKSRKKTTTGSRSGTKTRTSTSTPPTPTAASTRPERSGRAPPAQYPGMVPNTQRYSDVPETTRRRPHDGSGPSGGGKRQRK